MDTFSNFLSKVDDLVWGLPLIILILATGIFLTIRLKGIQIAQLPRAIKNLAANEKSGTEGEVSSFAALCTALSATIGTGNIVGVATAIVAGGPGALFWMWMAALVGTATKYSECLLAVKYRVVEKDGHIIGGPFYYIEKGMGKNWKWLARIFAFLGVCVGLFGIGTFSQINGITSAVNNFFDANNTHMVQILGHSYSWSVVISGLLITLCVALVLIGGLQRISSVAQVVVPFMAVLYVVSALLILIFNVTAIPGAIVTIVKSAFGLRAAAGGAIGAMIVAMQKGLGSTGSIGTQTLEVVRNNPELQVAALAAGKSVEQMEQQIREFHPLIAGMWSEEAAADLRSRVADLPVKVVSGMDGLLEIATMPQSQVLVTAIVGMIGIRPTIAAIEAGKDIALANKETLVTAGHIIMPLAAKMGVKILPVDSEHSAIFQSLNGEPVGRIEKILLTASGGPFRGRTREQLQNIQVEDALKHPNWSMGRKITIDSSTLVNKGLEVMEVKWLFGVDLDQIQVIVHPQSIIHSAVQYVDGAVIAQLGTPDMKLPIQYALFYPDRRPMPGKRLYFYELAQITFEKPDMETFFGLKLAYDAQRIGGSMPTVYNAANEKAVAMFLERRIAFLDIPDIIASAMEEIAYIKHPSVDEILATEAAVYEWIESRW